MRDAGCGMRDTGCDLCSVEHYQFSCMRTNNSNNNNDNNNNNNNNNNNDDKHTSYRAYQQSG